MMDVNYTYCGNHSTIYVNQVIMLCILNLYSAIRQLYLFKKILFIYVKEREQTEVSRSWWGGAAGGG